MVHMLLLWNRLSNGTVDNIAGVPHTVAKIAIGDSWMAVGDYWVSPLDRQIGESIQLLGTIH